MRITAIQPHRRSKERVHLHVDGEPRCELAAELVLRAGLRTGDAIDDDALAELERADAQWRARDAALSLLAVRPRAREELRRRLLRKQFEPAAVQRCLDALDREGLLDDAAYAHAHVRDRMRFKPRGSRVLRQELRAKGVAPEVAGAAIDDVLATEHTSEAELALESARVWVRRSARRAGRLDCDVTVERRRLYGFLVRRGFAADAIRAAMDEVLPPRDDI